MTDHQDPRDVPGALPTLPVSIGREPFHRAFIDEARKYWSNFHMQMGGDHAVYYATHLTEFIPHALALPAGGVSELTRELDTSVGATTYVRGGGERSVPLDQCVADDANRVCAVMILHHGRVVYESYPGIQPHAMHLWASVAKTTVGLVATLLEADGVLDVGKFVPEYVQEFAGTAWDDVRVIDVLNMATGLDIAETAEATMNPDSMFQRQLAADFGVPNAHGIQEAGIDVLRGAQPLADERPGEVARYSSLTCKVAAYVIERATDRPFTSVFEEGVWSHIGARSVCAIGLSPDGSSNPYGIVESTLEDLARFALLHTPSWHVVSGTQIVTDDVLHALQSSGSDEAYRRGDFTEHSWVKECFGHDLPARNSRQWDAVWADGALFKHGNLYQGIYADPGRDVVGVYFSTSPVSGHADPVPGYLRQAAKDLAGG
jgi:CubicO group peptidase (beta-lactamase class C family)